MRKRWPSRMEQGASWTLLALRIREGPGNKGSFPLLHGQGKALGLCWTNQSPFLGFFKLWDRRPRCSLSLCGWTQATWVLGLSQDLFPIIWNKTNCGSLPADRRKTVAGWSQGETRDGEEVLVIFSAPGTFTVPAALLAVPGAHHSPPNP